MKPEQHKSVVLFEGDEHLADEIVDSFAAEEQEIIFVRSAPELYATTTSRDCSILILDRLISGKDGLAFVKNMRNEGKSTPVIVISSLSSVDDRILCLKGGCDDYLVKPFVMSELVARADALRRRDSADRRISLQAGPLSMDLIDRSVFRGARKLDLKPKEFGVLAYLMRNANRIVTRMMLLEDVWSYHAQTETNVVDVLISSLRRKVDTEGEAKLIVSVRGSGFKLVI